MASPKSVSLSASSLEKAFLALIERTCWDVPADVDKAIQRAAGQEEEGTNGHAALVEISRAIDHARATQTIIGSDPASLHFTIEAPEGTDHAPFIEGANAATHAAATEGWIRTPMVDLPNGKPRRGKSLGPIPSVRFRTSDGPVRAHLWVRGPGEASIASVRTLPAPEVPGEPTLEGVAKIVVHAIHEAQGRAGGPGIVGVHVGSDPIDGFERAAEQILRPIGTKNPQRALNPIEDKVLEYANQLGVGPQGLGGRTTILAAHIGVSEVPADRWNVAVLVTSWACRRQSITLDAKGEISGWDAALSESSHRTPEEPETASEAELQAAADEKAGITKKTKKKAAKKKTATKTAATAETPAAKPAASAKKTAAKKTTKAAPAKTAAKKSTAKTTKKTSKKK